MCQKLLPEYVRRLFPKGMDSPLQKSFDPCPIYPRSQVEMPHHNRSSFQWEATRIRCVSYAANIPVIPGDLPDICALLTWHGLPMASWRRSRGSQRIWILGSIFKFQALCLSLTCHQSLRNLFEKISETRRHYIILHHITSYYILLHHYMLDLQKKNLHVGIGCPKTGPKKGSKLHLVARCSGHSRFGDCGAAIWGW